MLETKPSNRPKETKRVQKRKKEKLWLHEWVGGFFFFLHRFTGIISNYFFRYLRDEGYGHDIVKDKEFSSLRDVLVAKQQRLKAEGKGNRPNRSSTTTDEIVQKLWNSKELGTKNGKTLQNT